jgi:hypothetical protein
MGMSNINGLLKFQVRLRRRSKVSCIIYNSESRLTAGVESPEVMYWFVC